MMYSQVYGLLSLRQALADTKRARGSRTAGVDGITMNAFLGGHRGARILAEIACELEDHSYRPEALRSLRIKKTSGKMRELSIPTLKDRVVQRAIINVLSPALDPLMSSASHGFRPGRGVHTAVGALRIRLQRDLGVKYVLKADLKEAFPSVDRVLLMERLIRAVRDDEVIDLVRRIIDFRKQVSRTRTKPIKGLAQGAPLSPFLLNIALGPFDEHWDSNTRLLESLRRGTATSTRGDPSLVRYADDLVVMCRGSRGRVEHLRGLIDEWLKEALGMRLHDARVKTGVYPVVTGFDFLGRRFHRCRGSNRLKVEVSRSSLKKHQRRLREHALGVPLDAPVDTVIEALNTSNEGWLRSFHKEATAGVLARVDRATVTAMKCWLSRKHQGWRETRVEERYMDGTTYVGEKFRLVPVANRVRRALGRTTDVG
ncbi:reverse transcriptase domain-containing protein [Myxococcota bacterium]